MQATSALKTSSFRSLADLQRNFQQGRSFRTLADLQHDFQQRQSEYLCLLKPPVDADHAEQRSSAMIGSLKKVFQGKGFGFIVPGDGSEDVFLHFRDITNGDSRDLVVGTELHFELIIDESGNRKAKSATLTQPQEAERSFAESSTCQMYSRKMLLAALGALCRDDTSGILTTNPGVPSTTYMPRPEPQRKKSSRFYKQDPALNDEDCVIRLEDRLSDESGADVNNEETFGDIAKGGWTFEEALEAKQQRSPMPLRIWRFHTNV